MLIGYYIVKAEISYDGICRRYKVISLRLQENMGFLTEYKKTITNQDLEIDVYKRQA